MRKLFLFLSILVGFCKMIAQENSFEFKLIDSTSAHKDQLFVTAKGWISNTFVSSKAVIDMEDKEAGRIIGKSQLNRSLQNRCMMYKQQSYVAFTFTIDVKENKYRIILSDFIHSGNPTSAGILNQLVPPNGFGDGCGKKVAQRVYDEIKLDVKNQSESLLASFRNAMSHSQGRDNF